MNSEEIDNQSHSTVVQTNFNGDADLEDTDAEKTESSSSTDLEAAPAASPPTQATAPEAPTFQDFGPKVPLTRIRRVLVFLGITITLFLAALDQTIVTTTLPSIAKDFNNFADISWIGTSYL